MSRPPTPKLKKQILKHLADEQERTKEIREELEKKYAKGSPSTSITRTCSKCFKEVDRSEAFTTGMTSLRNLPCGCVFPMNPTKDGYKVVSNPFALPETKLSVPAVCTCDLKEMMWYGCKCGAMDAERKKNDS